MGCPHKQGGGNAGRRAGVGEILADHVAALRLGPHQTRVVRALIGCRTGAFGGHLERCDTCGAREVKYHSCRDRHCPRCGVLDQALWAEAQERSLLPVVYFHLVFTLPRVLHTFFRRAPALAYDLLFEAVSETLLELGQGLLGARLGLTAVLHTWNQQLLSHLHLHCLVPGGGLSEDGQRFVACRRSFLLPFKELRRVFRGKLLSKLEAAHAQARFGIAPTLGRHLLEAAARHRWRIYAKSPLAGPEHVVRYVSRYTRRIAISNSRIVGYDGKTVRFVWRDRAHGNRKRVLPLEAKEFCRRFVQHILPPRFVRIRHYGLLANRIREKSLARCRELIGAGQVATRKRRDRESRAEACLRLFGKDPRMCSVCRKGRMLREYSWAAGEQPPPFVTALVRGP